MKQKLIQLVNYPVLLSTALTLVVGGVAKAQVGTVPAALVTSAPSLGGSLFCPIIKDMFGVLIFIAIIMVLYAAYTYLTAGDDTEKVHRATKTMTYAAIAIVVAIIAFGFPALIGSIFSGISLSGFTCS